MSIASPIVLRLCMIQLDLRDDCLGTTDDCIMRYLCFLRVLLAGMHEIRQCSCKSYHRLETFESNIENGMAGFLQHLQYMRYMSLADLTTRVSFTSGQGVAVGTVIKLLTSMVTSHEVMLRPDKQ